MTPFLALYSKRSKVDWKLFSRVYLPPSFPISLHGTSLPSSAARSWISSFSPLFHVLRIYVLLSSLPLEHPKCAPLHCHASADCHHLHPVSRVAALHLPWFTPTANDNPFVAPPLWSSLNKTVLSLLAQSDPLKKFQMSSIITCVIRLLRTSFPHLLTLSCSLLLRPHWMNLGSWTTRSWLWPYILSDWIIFIPTFLHGHLSLLRSHL